MNWCSVKEFQRNGGGTTWTYKTVYDAVKAMKEKAETTTAFLMIVTNEEGRMVTAWLSPHEPAFQSILIAEESLTPGVPAWWGYLQYTGTLHIKPYENGFDMASVKGRVHLGYVFNPVGPVSASTPEEAEVLLRELLERESLNALVERVRFHAKGDLDA